DDRSHAVVAGRSRQWVPQQLGIEMSVKVDETRRNGKPVSIDSAFGATADSPGLDDAPILHRHVAEIRRQAAAIVNPSAFNQEVISHTSFSLAGLDIGRAYRHARCPVN